MNGCGNLIIRFVFAAAVIFVSPSVSSADSVVSNSVARPSTWAVLLEKPGLPNLFRVTDSLYRGAQPAPEGITELKAMGIETVLNLRSLHTDDLGDTGLGYFSIPMNSWHSEEEDVVAFLKIVSDTNNLPIFVHCQHGSDRTGTMCAIYRVAVQGWSKEDALKEMREGGYGFHPVWQNLVNYFNALDIEKLKKEAGLK